MAKGLRSKVKRRWRNLKRGHIDNIVSKPRLQKLSKNLQATIIGVQYRQEQKKNAFLHPQDPNSEFPQYKPAPIIDLRSTSIPGSGRQYVGASRKYIKNQIKDRQIEEQSVEQQIKIDRSLIKKDKNKKSKLRKTIVF